MPRIRTIKPEFWTDSLMVQLPPLARLLYIAMWTAADDYGCIRDEPERLAMELMPRESELEVDGLIQLLVVTGRVSVMINEDGSRYIHVGRWLDHQRVDRPSDSRLLKLGSRKMAVPYSVRQGVASKYGCEPGETHEAQCFYCHAAGEVIWWRNKDGRPSAWVVFPGLELDHLESESDGGSMSAENFVLACRRCNRSKGSRYWFDFLCEKHGVLPTIAKDRETSREFASTRSGKEGKGRERKGKEEATVVGLDDDAWTRWLDYRKTIRRPLKPVSIPAAQRELAAFGAEQSAVVEQSIAQGWQGLFALKPRGMNGSRPPGRRLKTADEIEAEERIHAVG